MIGLSERRVPASAGAWGWGERQRVFVELERRVRTAMPTSRRISLLSLAGGTGTSTVAAGAAAVSAERRGTPVLAVDACGSVAGLGAELGFPPEERLTLPDPVRTEARTLADAVHGLPPRGHLRYLGLGHPASASWPVDVEEWRGATASIGRFFPLVLTDWGRRRDLREIADIARASHAVCLVAEADRAGLAGAAALVSAIRGDAHRPDVTIVLVDRAGHGPAATRLRLGSLDAPVLRIPFDASLASGTAPSRRTRRALLAVAAELVDGGGARP